MSSGGYYYGTAVKLRAVAADAGKALANLPERRGWAREYDHGLEALALTITAVGLELAASVYCLAQAVEDRR